MSDTPPVTAVPDDALISVHEARARMAAAIRPVGGRETVALDAALGRVLANAVVSPIDVPAHDNSAMDGYALAGSDLPEDGETQLLVVGRALAGAPWPGRLLPGQALRIMTGAMLPDGADTVMPQEVCQREDDMLRLRAGHVRSGANLRRRGEDLLAGQPALRAGRVLRPADLGLLASLGIDRVEVRPMLRVALFSTGDELRAPGQPLPPGCIHDSNRHSLMAALRRLGMEVIDLGLVPDDPQALAQALAEAVERADAVVTSGGVSVGDADHTRALLARFGEVDFWSIAMRPGKPFAFGVLRTPPDRPLAVPRWLFALPGNPVAALVSFYVLARDALLQLAGARTEPLPRLRVRAAEAVRKSPGRAEFQRVILSAADDGHWQAHLTGPQGAGVLRSMSQAHALLVLDAEQGPVSAGDWVEVWLFEGLV